MTLTEFLLARIAEDEAVARAAVSASAREWRAQSFRVVTSDSFEVAEASVPTAAHIARHDPVRVLAECEAKRRIVELHDLGHDPCDAHDASFESIPCETLEHLALPYADHTDYLPEWKP